MNYHSTINQLNIEINRLSGSLREMGVHEVELQRVLSRLENLVEDLIEDARLIDDPENGHEWSRGTIATTHDEARDKIKHAYSQVIRQVEEMIRAAKQRRSNLKQEIEYTREITFAKEQRVSKLKIKQRLLE